MSRRESLRGLSKSLRSSFMAEGEDTKGEGHQKGGTIKKNERPSLRKFLKDNTSSSSSSFDSPASFKACPTDWGALHKACAEDNVLVVRLLLADPRNLVNHQEKDGFTPLAAACVFGALEVMQLLLEDPMTDVNLPNTAGQTPIWQAVHEGQLEVIKKLLISGRAFDLSLKPPDASETLADVAEKKGKQDVAMQLRALDATPTEATALMRRKYAYQGSLSLSLSILLDSLLLASLLFLGTR